MPKATIVALIATLSLVTAGNLSAQSSGALLATATVIDMAPARSGLDAAIRTAGDLTTGTPSVQTRREIPGASVLADSIAVAADPLRRTAAVTLLYW